MGCSAVFDHHEGHTVDESLSILPSVIGGADDAGLARNSSNC
jgi:hypothetical protein